MKNWFRLLSSLGCWLLLHSIGSAQIPAESVPLDAQYIIPDRIVVKLKQVPNAAGARRTNIAAHPAFRQLPVAAVHQPFAGRKAFTDSSFARRKTAIHTAAQAELSLSNIVHLQFKPSSGPGAVSQLEEALRQLRRRPDVEYAEPLYQYESLGTYLPNDAQVKDQYYLQTIHAYEAWQVEQGNPAVVIGIADWGFSITDQELKGKVFCNEGDPVNGVDDDHDGYIDNYDGWNLSDRNRDLSGSVHGTQVAGLAAAQTDNGTGIAGLAFNSRFMPVKVQGKGGFVGMESIVYLADRGCKVINLSWGRRGGPSAYEEEIINYAALQKDVVIVAAAGNDGREQCLYPAAYTHVLAVAATNAQDQKWSGSNYGQPIDITAPGQDMFGLTGSGYGGIGSGTSFATPLVTAAAALVRSQFPELSAEQVRERLKNTADPIDAQNPAYAGKLGSGRLNVYRALTEGNPRVFQLADQGLTIGEEAGSSGRNAGVWVRVKANVRSGGAVVARLTTASSLVQITRETAELGTFTAGETRDNLGQSFTIRLSAGIPADSLISFQLSLTDGSKTEKVFLQLNANPSHQTLRNDQLSLMMSKDGSIGFQDSVSVKNTGANFSYRGQNVLSGAGLLLGVSATQVSDNVPENPKQPVPLAETHTAFVPLQYPRSIQAAGRDATLAGSFSDTLHNPARIGLAVTYSSYTWQEDKYVIMEYQIRNISGGTIDRLQAGFFADWDIAGPAENQSDWDTENGLGYVYNRRQGGPYAGLKLLSRQTPNYTGLDNSAYAPVQVFDGFTKEEKFRAIGPGITYRRTAVSATDVAQVLSATLENLGPGETRTVAFALLVGDNLKELKASALVAQEKFKTLKSGPVPQQQNLAVCRNTALVVQAVGGTHFRLYDHWPATEAKAEGTLFQLISGDEASTYYLTNADSLFESAPAAIQVEPYRTRATANRSVIYPDSAQRLEISDQSRGTVWRRWDMGDGTVIRDSAAISYLHAEPGEYVVQLTTLNAAGCQDTFTHRVTVMPSIPEAHQQAEPAIRLYPNPARGLVTVELPAGEIPVAARLFDSMGRERDGVAIKPAAAGEYTLDFSTQPAGFYQLRIQVGARWISRQLVLY